MNREIHFRVFDEDEPKWLYIKRAILRTRGKLRGVMGSQIIEWCMKGLEMEEEKKKEKEKIFRSDKINRLAKLYTYLPDLPTKKDFRNHVMNLGVTSNPTVRDYLNFFLAKGLLSPHHVNPLGVKVFKKESIDLSPTWFREIVEEIKEKGC